MRALDPESFEPFGNYLLLRPLGKGGMGVVYVARSTSEAHPLTALKRLRPDAARLPGFRERFWHEGEIALRLDHPNVIETVDVGEVDGQPYVAAALVFGKDLQKLTERLVSAGADMPAPVMVRILLDVLTGLAYVHGAREPDGRALRLVHRDVTPGNLLVGYNGKTRVTDFGAAKSLLSEPLAITSEGMIIGTPRYLAPEVIRGQPATPASDLYSLGAVAYRVLAKVPPYDGTPKEIIEQVIRQPPRPLASLRPELPRGLLALVDQMMSHDLAVRPSSARELARTLEAEAVRARMLGSHEDVSRFLGALFEEERRQEREEYDAMKRIQRELVPSAPEGTRILAKAGRLEASVDLPPTMPPERTAPTSSGAGLGEAPPPTVVAPAPVVAFTPITDDTGFEDAELEPKTAKAPAPKRARRTRTFVIAMALAVVAGFLFQQLVLGPEEERRFQLVERLGTARRELEALRATGRLREGEADALVDRVKRAVVDGDVLQGELDLQELQLFLDRARRARTATTAE